jgi:uncharacterized protein
VTHSVAGGTVFGAYLEDGDPAPYALVSCVVAPGFDYADWEMRPAADLRAAFPGPDAAEAIARLGAGEA